MTLLEAIPHILIAWVCARTFESALVKRFDIEYTSTGHPSTTKTSKEYPSVVENTCASRMLSPMSESKADSYIRIKWKEKKLHQVNDSNMII